MRGYTKRVGKQVERICVSNPLASVTLSPCKQVLNSHFGESFSLETENKFIFGYPSENHRLQSVQLVFLSSDVIC